MEDKRLQKTIDALVSFKPDTRFDVAFTARLRNKLLHAPTKIKTPYREFIFSKAFYGVTGSLLTLLIVAPLTYLATRYSIGPVSEPEIIQEVKDLSSQLSLKQQISSKGTNAFGTITQIPIAMDATSTVSSDPSTTSSEDETSYYSYAGEKVELKDAEGKVFKRTTGADSGKQLAKLIQNAKFSLADFSTFSTFELKSIELKEDKMLGYMISVNVEEGMISITPNNQGWNENEKPATSSASLDANAAISLADQFIKDHVIDISIYGKPHLNARKSTATTTVVVYPLMIENLEVYTERGEAHGLQVTIDSQNKRVVTLTNLTSQTYESSSYKLETDFNKIISQIATTTVKNTAELKTPKKILMQYTSTDKTGSVELFVPALLFPAAGKAEPIVVPLIKDSLDKLNALYKPEEGQKI